MRFFDRLSNGWKLGLTSFNTIRENKSLLVFPVLSGAALLLVVLSFAAGFWALTGFDFESSIAIEGNETLSFITLFLFYLINFFIIVFFNVGLVHCARLIFEGKEATISDGISFSLSRIGAIISWAVLAATVGVILKTLEERLGWIGQIVIGIIGVVWAIATFFVVPVIAYEDVGPIEALKRSTAVMKEKWGEAIGANFSFGLFFLLGYIFIILIGIALFTVNPVLAVISIVLSALFLHTVVSAAKTVFLAAAYQHIHHQPTGNFDGNTLDSIFMPKKK